ncbi:hypothetical protein DL771_005050 [Monosporascus sp. 5C6A]|nr:hypothetical protein DL771_005050 [Monosporascus sp. 5C6A]
MPQASRKAKEPNVDPEDAIRLEEAMRQFRVEKEARFLASLRTTDHLLARVRGGDDTEPQGPQPWRDDIECWNKHAPEVVRPSSANKSMSYQEDRETPTMWPRIHDEEDLEFNPLRQSPQPSVLDSYDSGYGLAERHIPHRPSTDILELSGETELEAAGTPSPSTKYEISRRTLSDCFHLSRPYSGSQEAEGEQAQPVLTVLRTTTRVYQVHRVPPTQSRGSAHGGEYDPEQAKGSISPEFDQRCLYQTRKPHGWYEDWAAETTDDEAKGLEHGSSTSVSRYSNGSLAQPSGAKRSRSCGGSEEEIRDEDAMNDEDDGIETTAYSRSTFASRKRLCLS